MAKVTKTNREMLQLVQAINVLSSTKEFADSNTKGIKKLKKIGDKLKEHLDAYNEKLEDIRLDHANTDENGSLLLNDKGDYKFSKDGLKNMNKKIKDLLDETFEFYQLTFSTEGIENFLFLDGWVEGIELPAEEADDAE